MNLTHSILLTGPTGAGKSSFARKALEAEGSGIVLASPYDELDSYVGLEPPKYIKGHFDDGTYLPSAITDSKPTGLTDAIKWLYERWKEVASDVAGNRPVRYNVLVLDTVSAFSTLAMNMAVSKFGQVPPAISPDGAAYYNYLRLKQEELLRLARAFRGYGVHLIALAHEVETEVGEHQAATAIGSKSKQHLPAVHGGFKIALPSFFSTVLHAGVMQSQGKPVHFIQWKADPKRPTKNRFGELDKNDKLHNDWNGVKLKIEAAAAAMGAK